MTNVQEAYDLYWKLTPLQRSVLARIQSDCLSRDDLLRIQALGAKAPELFEVGNGFILSETGRRVVRIGEMRTVLDPIEMVYYACGSIDLRFQVDGVTGTIRVLTQPRVSDLCVCEPTAAAREAARGHLLMLTGLAGMPEVSEIVTPFPSERGTRMGFSVRDTGESYTIGIYFAETLSIPECIRVCIAVANIFLARNAI